MSLIFQPYYGKSIGDFLKRELTNSAWDGLLWAVAFTKASGTKHIRGELADFSKRGSVKLALGLDHKGSSYEGLYDLRKTIGDAGSIFVVHNEAHSTFHPKIYSFYSSTAAIALIGSGNLTEGGLYTNYEAATVIRYDLNDTAQRSSFEELTSIVETWTDTNSDTVNALTAEFLEELRNSGLLTIEEEIAQNLTGKGSSGSPLLQDGKSLFGFQAPPKAPAATSIVKKKGNSILHTAPTKATPAMEHTEADKVAVEAASKIDPNPRTLLMQIKPHGNGEIFLSKLAVNEDPDFFGYPFSGQTTPKRAGRAPYPQRDPDPVVNVTVYGANDNVVLALNHYSLNTVYYTAKSEIRITASPLVSVVPEYSVMRMSEASGQHGIDYVIDIFTPAHSQYDALVSQCDKAMPGGGKKPRRYGWA